MFKITVKLFLIITMTTKISVQPYETKYYPNIAVLKKKFNSKIHHNLNESEDFEEDPEIVIQSKTH